MFMEYGSGSLPDWLESLCIPRNIDNLQQVKDLWEVGTVNCPPLHKWTVVMRNHRSTKTGKNSSLFSQRKFIYNLFKNFNFDENIVFAQYNELRPGKLYKILNTKSKLTINHNIWAPLWVFVPKSKLRWLPLCKRLSQRFTSWYANYHGQVEDMKCVKCVGSRRFDRNYQSSFQIIVFFFQQHQTANNKMMTSVISSLNHASVEPFCMNRELWELLKSIGYWLVH